MYMKHSFFSRFFLCGFVLMLVFFSSCSARISGTLRDDGSADVTVRATVGPRMAVLIRSLSNVNTNPSPDAPVIDGSSIARSLGVAPGVKSASFGNINPTTIDGTITIAQIDRFLATQTIRGGKNLITYEPVRGRRPGRISIEIDRNSGPQIIGLISPDVVDYLSAIMAPIATGEVLSKAEYLDLVRSVYNKQIADEIAAARIRASIDFPQNISDIRGGNFNEKRAEFDIALLDMLVLERPLHYEIFWQ
jgi:hypothetical protein